MRDEATLDAMLSHWQAEHARGEEVPPEALCQGQPELLPELQRRIALLRQAERLERQADATALHRPTGSQAEGATALPAVAGFEILGELGRGGMGVVYKARQLAAARVVAVKTTLAAGERERARFRTEAEAAARLRHPNIAQVYHVGEWSSPCGHAVPYFAMEFCPGGSLEKKLVEVPLPPPAAAALLETLARAIHYAHSQHVLHRDLKPANVLLTEDGTAKVADFGLARKLDEPGLTQTGEVMGTPSYMAPEQARGDPRMIGPAADIYALGAVLYECLTGRPPFRAATGLDTLLQVLNDDPVPLRRLNPKLPRDLETICLKCLDKEPGRRYPAAADLADDLRRYVEGRPVQARPVNVVAHAWRWCRRNQRVASLAATLVLVILGSLFGMTALSIRARANEAQTLANLDLARSSLSKASDAVNECFTTATEHPLLRDDALHPVRDVFVRAAQTYHYTACELQEQLHRQNPTDLGLQRELAQTYLDIANNERFQGRPNESLRYYEQSAALWEKVIGVQADPQGRSKQAHVWTMLGDHWRTQSDRPKAAAYYQQARSAQEELLRADPANSDFKQALGRTVHSLGYFHALVSGDREQALQDYETARDLQEELVKEHPNVALYKSALATTCNNLGILHRRLSQPEKALRYYQRAADMNRELILANPRVLGFKHSLAGCLGNLGTIHRDLRKPTEARDFYEQSKTLLKELVALNREHTEYRHDLAITHANLADLARQARRWDEAIRGFREAAGILEGLVKAEPDNFYFRSNLGAIRGDLGNTLVGSGRPEDALEPYGQAVRHQSEVHQRIPEVPKYRHLLGKHYSGLAAAQMLLGRPAEAAASIVERRKLFPTDSAVLYQCACALALCVPAIGEGKSELGAREQAERQETADRAIETLRQAVAAGFKDVAQLKNEANLNSLRSRPDFQRLLAELEGEAVAEVGFFALAAACIRRELLDLARHQTRAKRGGGARAVPLPQGVDSGDVPDPRDDPADLKRWEAFHEAVEALPVLEREVVGLTFYHGWTRTQVAELLGVDESTVRRRWRAAFLKLSAALGGGLPEL